MFLLYHFGDSLVTLELISLKPLVGTPETDLLAVKLLVNRLCMNLFKILILILGRKQGKPVRWHEQKLHSWRIHDQELWSHRVGT